MTVIDSRLVKGGHLCTSVHGRFHDPAWSLGDFCSVPVCVKCLKSPGFIKHHVSTLLSLFLILKNAINVNEP